MNPQDGPIDEPKGVADVRQEPYGLPATFEWCECDMRDAATVKEVRRGGGHHRCVVFVARCASCLPSVNNLHTKS